MPECVEVKLFVETLNKYHQGQNLNSINIVGGRFLKEGIAGLLSLHLPLKNAQFKCKGKFIYFEFDDRFSYQNKDHKLYFFITLGMSGSFSHIQNKHSAVKFSFSNGDVFYPSDSRKLSPLGER